MGWTTIARLGVLHGLIFGLFTHEEAFARQPSATISPAMLRTLEAKLRLPQGTEALDHYTRYYTATRAKTVDDLPFSTIFDGVRLRKGQPLILGIFALPHKWESFPAGLRVVTPSAFPQFVHGGCWAVNVVYDPVREKVLGVWCNIDDHAEPPHP